MKSLLFVLLAGYLAPLAQSQSVIISEFMADDDRTLKNDFDEDADWIEINNTGTTPVDLAGWRLTDDATKLSKWVFPSRIIAPGGYEIVFADDRNRKVTGQPLHTNFALSKGGEYLALIRPDGSKATEFAAKFPAQATDISYGFSQNLTVVAAPQGADCQAGVPTDATDYSTNFTDWKTSLTNPTGTSWQAGHTGVGFDSDTASYGTLISNSGGDLSARMKNLARIACLRIPFNVTNPATVVSIRLRMKYDDGFIAWVNGVQIAADAAPASPQWNSLATVNRNETLNNDWTDFTIPASALNLQAGTNILAIQGFNITASSSDFLLLPVLEVNYSASSATPVYFTTPTPGSQNGTGGPIGPVFASVTTTIPRPTGNASSPAAAVTATVSKTVNKVDKASVKMFYRTMFGAETSVTLLDDGVAPDVVSGDDTYTGILPTTGPTGGQMLRWRFQVADTSILVGRSPVYLDPEDNDYYYGTVAVDPSEATSQLPVLSQFIETPSAADTRAGTRGAVFYLGRFYDNIGINLHGQTSAGFAKKSLDLDFNGDNRFVWKEDAARTAKDINLLTNYADKTRFRNTLAQEVAAIAGAPYHFAFPVRVQRNAAFHGVMDMVEDGDDRMLERNGLNPQGALYKMYDALVSTANGEKKTRKEEDKTDLQALITGLNPATALATRRIYAYDNVNLPAAVDYLATRQLNSDSDHGHKNYYIYRDTGGTNEWRPIIWDVDLTFGHNYSGSSGGYFNDAIVATNPITPGQNDNNRLYKLLSESSEFRAMYTRRLRTLMDTVLQPSGTTNGFLETRMRAIVASIDPDPAVSTWTDGDLDFTKWGTWGRGLKPREETEYTITNYIAPRRTFLYDISATRPLYGGTPIPDSAQTDTAGIVAIDSVDYLPATQTQEYILLKNTTANAVDISGWKLSGGIEHTFEGGTVIPPGDGSAASDYQGLLHVVKNAAAFRARSTGPTGGQRRLIQGNYTGQLSARGESVELRNAAGLLISTFSYPGTPTVLQNALRISEIQYHAKDPTSTELASLPSSTGDSFEYLEFVNISGAAINLSGAFFSQGLVYTFPGGTTLAAGARLILAADPAAFALRYPGTAATVVGPYQDDLDNGGERLELVDAVGEVILDFEYKDGWYPDTDGSGRALVLRDTATAYNDFGNAVSWATSSSTLGTPGAAETAFANSYYGWDNFHFTEAEREDLAVSGPTVDSDGDGRPNFLEYALCSDPRKQDLGHADFQYVEAGMSRYPGIRFTRPVNAIDLQYRLLAADSPAGPWTEVSATLTTPVAAGPDQETVVLRETSVPAQAKRFLRLKVTRTP